MIQPSYEHKPRLASNPDYIQSFDSDYHPSECKEQLEATALIRTALEDVILANMQGLGGASNKAGVYSELQLNSFDFDGKPIKIDLYCCDTAAHPDLDPYIFRLSEGSRYMGGGYMRVHDYSIPSEYSDEGARRRDVLLAEPQPSRVNDLAEIESQKAIDSEVIKSIGALVDFLNEADENHRLERQMGINDQPIGFLEARAISLFISRAQLRPKNILKKK